MHKRNIYRGKIDGHDVLGCQKIYDYVVASTNVKAGEKFIKYIDDKVTTMNLGMGSETPLGLFARYNGLDIHQTRAYILLSSANYIDRVLQALSLD